MNCCRFFLKETTTIVRVKPTSDLNTPYVALTICPNFHSAYRKDMLRNTYNLSVNDYRYNSKWYPTKDINRENAKEFFHNITYGLNDVIYKMEISTFTFKYQKLCDSNIIIEKMRNEISANQVGDITTLLVRKWQLFIGK